MKSSLFTVILLVLLSSCNSLVESGVHKKDLKKDVALLTSEGTIVLRLYDDTPLHRNNFLRLVNEGMYDSILFHRAIKDFMIQAGQAANSDSFEAKKKLINLPDSIPKEVTADHFHKRAALGAARPGDDTNPTQSSSNIHFYLVQGKVYTDSTLAIAEGRINKMLAYNAVINSPENAEMYKRFKSIANFNTENTMDEHKIIKDKFDSLTLIQEQTIEKYSIPNSHREVYKTIGGAAHLDQNYTVFGEVISGMEIVDKIAAVETNRSDKPEEDILILSAQLIKRKD
ncbi:peptidylprolyl isomerase [Algoriphagus chordae]|nr:peptidylprolyl isomerase [Algoriphagus chordae]